MTKQLFQIFCIGCDLLIKAISTRLKTSQCLLHRLLHRAANGHRLAIEIGFPIHQDLNGTQMETDLRVMLGWQWAF